MKFWSPMSIKIQANTQSHQSLCSMSWTAANDSAFQPRRKGIRQCLTTPTIRFTHPLLISHASWSLVWLSCLRINACGSEQRLLLFLNQGTTLTAPGRHAVPAAISFDAEAGSHVTSLHELYDPSPMTEYFKAVPSTALGVVLVETRETARGCDNSRWH